MEMVGTKVCIVGLGFALMAFGLVVTITGFSQSRTQDRILYIGPIFLILIGGLIIIYTILKAVQNLVKQKQAANARRIMMHDLARVPVNRGRGRILVTTCRNPISRRCPGVSPPALSPILNNRTLRFGPQTHGLSDDDANRSGSTPQSGHLAYNRSDGDSSQSRNTPQSGPPAPSICIGDTSQSTCIVARSWFDQTEREREEDEQAIYLEPTDPDDFSSTYCDDPPPYHEAIANHCSGISTPALQPHRYGAVVNPALEADDEDDQVEGVHRDIPPPPYEEVCHITQTSLP